MSTVVELQPARSVEFDSEAEVLADKLSEALATCQVLLSKIETSSPFYPKIIKLMKRLIRSMSSIENHIVSIEEEMKTIFEDVQDGDMIWFDTHDVILDAIVSSYITTRCYTIRVHKIQCRKIMYAEHQNDDLRINKRKLSG